MRGLFMLWLALSPAVDSTPLVTCTITTPSILGGNVNLTCEFKANLDVLQVTWQKKRGKDIQNMVTHSEKYGVNIARPFQQRIAVLRASSRASSIMILKLTREDEACYDCLFNAYPNGAYTGEVCLKELQLINEVSCNAKGNDLRVKLDPQEIETRPSVPEVSTVHGHFTDTINPSCTFQKEQSKRIKRNAREGPKDPVQGADEVVHINCKTSGTTRFDISWQNEERPLSTEYIKNVTGNVTTVSSTLMYTLSSFPADHEIICNIIHSSESQFTQSDRQLGSTDGSQDDSGKQNRSWDRYPIYIVAACILVVVVFGILILYKARKKMEVKTPRKIKINNDEQVTPISVKVTTYGTATPLSHINLSTPLMGDQAKCKEPCSSVKNRKVSPSENAALKKKLAF